MYKKRLHQTRGLSEVVVYNIKSCKLSLESAEPGDIIQLGRRDGDDPKMSFLIQYLMAEDNWALLEVTAFV